MAMQRSEIAGYLAKIKGQGTSAHKKHKGDMTTYGGGLLPAGIDDGIAQLSNISFGQFKEGPNQGHVYFIARAVVLEPESVKSIAVRGLHTQIGPEALCDTPDASGKRKTFEDHYAWMLNELRKLGVDTNDLEFDDIESTVELLVEEKPYFRFRTWKGQATAQFPNPKVNHDWQGLIKDYIPKDANDTLEQYVDAAESNISPETIDLDDLVSEIEDDGNVDSQDKLMKIALSLGLTRKQIESAKSWTEVVTMIREIEQSRQQGKDEEKEEEEEEKEPVFDTKSALSEVKIGQNYQYYDPIMKKTHKVRVTAADKKTGVVKVKSLTDKKSVFEVEAIDLTVPF